MNTTTINGKQYIHLQGVGKWTAIAYGDVKVGTIIVYNGGVKSTVIAVSEKSAASVVVTTIENGKEYTSIKRKSTLIGYGGEAVIAPTPVCGTCGGEGDCPDCMVWDAPLTEVLVDLHNDGMTDTDTYASVEAAILADCPVQVAEAAPACPDCDGADWDCQACNAEGLKVQAAPKHPDDILTRLDAAVVVYHDSGFDKALYQDAADEIRRLQVVITDLQADFHECERARTATSEAFAGYVKQTEAQVATFETEAEQLRGERDHYLRGLNEYARVQPWDMATSRDEAEEIGERYARAKADKFSLYAD